jgi:hypothetical protein
MNMYEVADEIRSHTDIHILENTNEKIIDKLFKGAKILVEQEYNCTCVQITFENGNVVIYQDYYDGLEGSDELLIEGFFEGEKLGIIRGYYENRRSGFVSSCVADIVGRLENQHLMLDVKFKVGSGDLAEWKNKDAVMMLIEKRANIPYRKPVFFSD